MEEDTVIETAKTSLLPQDQHSEFEVFNPHLQAGHYVYSVKGVDKKGPFEGTRRYKEFFSLH